MKHNFSKSQRDRFLAVYEKSKNLKELAPLFNHHPEMTASMLAEAEELDTALAIVASYLVVTEERK